jgi:hypothetical protein
VIVDRVPPFPYRRHDPEVFPQGYGAADPDRFSGFDLIEDKTGRLNRRFKKTGIKILLLQGLQKEIDSFPHVFLIDFLHGLLPENLMDGNSLAF